MVEAYSYVLFTDALYALPDGEREEVIDRLEDKYLRGLRDDSSYYEYVRSVERRRERHPDRFRHYGAVRDPEAEDRGEGEVIEREAANPSFC